MRLAKIRKIAVQLIAVPALLLSLTASGSALMFNFEGEIINSTCRTLVFPRESDACGTDSLWKGLTTRQTTFHRHKKGCSSL